MNKNKLKVMNKKINMGFRRPLCMILTIMMVFAIIFESCSSTSYAKITPGRYEYTFKMNKGQKYVVIADIEEGKNGGKENISIVGSTYNGITSTVDGKITEKPSLYSIITEDYQYTYNQLPLLQGNATASGNANTSEVYERALGGIVGRAQDVINMLELFVTSQKNNDKSIYAELLVKVANKSERKILVNATGKNIKYGKDKKSYKDIILKNATVYQKSNPFYDGGKSEARDSIYYADFKLSEYYTDIELIRAYENSPNKSSLSWITKNETTNVQADNSNYSLFFDNTTDKDAIYLKVKNNTTGLEVSSFLIALKSNNDKYEEITYTNNSTSQIDWVVTSKKMGFEENNPKANNNAEMALYFHKDIGGNLEMIDRYYNSFSKKIDMLGKVGFVAVRNAARCEVQVYSVDRSGKKEVVMLIGAMNLQNIKSMLVKDTVATIDGDWYLEKVGSIIKIYNKNLLESEIADNTYYLNIENIFTCYVDSAMYYDVVIPVSKGSSTNFASGIQNEKGSYIALLSSGKMLEKDYKKNTDPVLEFKRDYDNGLCSMYVTIYKQTDNLKNIGNEKKAPLKLGCYKGNAKGEKDIPPALLIKEILQSGNSKDIISNFSSDEVEENNKGYNNALEDKTEITVEFIAQIVKYGRMILIVVLFLAIVMAGFNHMIKGAVSGEERAKTKETIKYILGGCAIFILLSLIIVLMIEYVDKGAKFMGEYVYKFDTELFESEETDYRSSLLLDAIELIIRTYNTIAEDIIQAMLKYIQGTSDTMNYIAVIYNCYDDTGKAVSNMRPFSENGVEWTRCLSGYNAFVSIALILIIVSIIKTAAEYVIYAGNEKKIVEVKETWLRIMWAILLIVTVPYMIQALIYLFNYMTAAVPVNVKDSRFELNLNYKGVLGAIAENMFINTKFKLCMAFMVRHLMLDILLVSAPIVIALWVISSKFRSFHIWFGELITNIAMQFCYAVGFLVLILLSYEGENPLYGLLLVSISLALSKFIKDSLQGYFQAWGGINEEGEGDALLGQVFGWKGKAIKNIKAFGGGLEKVSKFIDKDQGSRLGISLNNVGTLLQGRPKNLKFKSDRLRGLKKVAQGNMKEDIAESQLATADYEDSYRGLTDSEKQAMDAYVENGMQNDNFERQTGGIYDKANRYIDARKQVDKRKAEVKSLDEERQEVASRNPISKMTERFEDRAINQFAPDTTEEDSKRDAEEAKSKAKQKEFDTAKQTVMEDPGKMYEVYEDNIKSFTDNIADASLSNTMAGKINYLEKAMKQVKDFATNDAIFTGGDNSDVIEYMAGLIADAKCQIYDDNGIELDRDLVSDMYKDEMKAIYSKMEKVSNQNDIEKVRQNKPDNLNFIGDNVDFKEAIDNSINKNLSDKINDRRNQ